MVARIVLKEQIRGQILKVLSGYCFKERFNQKPSISIVSPWISDVQLETNDETIALDEEYFKTIYCIASVNLAHALLLLRIAFGVDITIATLPPSEQNYNIRAGYAKDLLDFLDEIGCNVYVNPNLHAKFLLSNDFALVGSFNLSKAALYDREEIGKGIDDIENMRILETYLKEIISESEPYGYTLKLRKWKRSALAPYSAVDISMNPEISHHHFELSVEPITEKLTRGWLYEDILRLWGRRSFQSIQDDAWTLLNEWLQLEPYYDDVLRAASSDLDSFYSRAFSIFLNLSPESLVTKEESREFLSYLRQRFGYLEELRSEDILNFLHSKQARERVPTKQLHLYSFKHPDLV